MKLFSIINQKDCTFKLKKKFEKIFSSLLQSIFQKKKLFGGSCTSFHLIFLLFITHLSGREGNTTLLYRPVPQRLLLRLLYRVQERAKLFGYDGRVPHSIDSLEYHCNMAYVSQFCRYYNEFCLNEIIKLLPENHAFLHEYVME